MWKISGDPADMTVAEARVIVDRCMAAGGAYPFPSPRTPDRPVSGNPGLRFGIRREIGIGDVRLYDPRHSHASRCVTSGGPLRFVCRMPGHGRCSMTLRCVHAADRDVEALAERVGVRMAALSRGG